MKLLLTFVIICLIFAAVLMAFVLLFGAVHLFVERDAQEGPYLTLLFDHWLSAIESGLFVQMYWILLKLTAIAILAGIVWINAGTWIRDWRTWSVDPKLRRAVAKREREFRLGVRRKSSLDSTRDPVQSQAKDVLGVPKVEAVKRAPPVSKR